MSKSTEATAALISGVERKPELTTIEIPALEQLAMMTEVQAATLCGTDIHLWHSAEKSMPYIPGHESCGVITQMNGERFDVTGERLKIGDRIIWAYPFCGECYYCTVANQPTMCDNASRFGREPVERYPHLLGGCATHQYVPPKSAVVKVPNNVKSELASSAGCALRTIMHGFERLGSVAAHEIAVVQGTGPVGLYALAVAKSKGFKRVLSIGAPETRIALANTWGADATLNIDEVPQQSDRIKWVLEQTHGLGADVVIQCAGNAAIPEGLEMTRAGGRYLSIGDGGSSKNIEITPRTLSVKMLNLIGVRSGAGRHFYQALEFLSNAKFPFDDLISGNYSLDKVADAFDGMKQMTEVKAAIFPNT